MAKRAKVVSKQYGTKVPTKESRKGLPAKGFRTRKETTAAMTTKRTPVKVLSSQAALYVGRPGFKGNIPGPVDGKLPVKRVMKRDPARGLTLPSADKITSAGVDLIGKQSPTIKIQPLPGTPGNKYAGRGRKVVPTPRKSQPVFSNVPGRVRRSPGQK